MLTPAELAALIADGFDEAEAAAGTPGYAEAVTVAETTAALFSAWDAALRPALAALAVSALDTDDDGTITEAEMGRLEAVAASVVAVVSGGFVARALGPYLAGVLSGYRRSAQAVVPALAAPLLAPLGGPDDRAAFWLERHEAYWVTRYGERFVEPRIAGLLREVAERTGPFSGGDAAGAQALRDALGAEYDRGLTYWRLVAVAASHRSGSLGRVAALEAAGLDGRVDATLDRRTTEVCQFLDGKTVPLSTLTAWRDAVLGAPTPDAVRAADPWWRDADVPRLRALLASNGGAVPPEVGLPGWHGFCRSIIVAA